MVIFIIIISLELFEIRQFLLRFMICLSLHTLVEYGLLRL